MNPSLAYLDWNATAPLRAEARAAMVEALDAGGNASSVHRLGRSARRRIDEAREAVAGLVGAMSSQVVFTSGGTEANDLALNSIDRPVLVSAVEHASVLEARAGAAVIPVDREGIIDLAALDQALRRLDRPALVSVMLANNETGILQPIADVARLAHKHGALLHCDGVQAVGRIQVDVDALGVDLLTISSHKLGGPPGAGALIVGSGLDVAPRLRGGGQEARRRAGTENMPAIAGFGAAARACVDGADWQKIANLRDRLERAIAEHATESVVIGRGVARLPNTSAIALPGVDAATQVMALDLDGVAVSAGAACSSGKVGASHVLAAMGVAPEIRRATIRVSLGGQTTEADIELFVASWSRLRDRCGARAAA